mgnify:CR=1 FL=1
MSIAHKWLEQEPWPTQVMPKKLLESRIQRVLTLTNIGYLGTVKKDGSPIVSPVEFYNDGFNLYVFPQPNSPKVHALRRDPRSLNPDAVAFLRAEQRRRLLHAVTRQPEPVRCAG